MTAAPIAVTEWKARTRKVSSVDIEWLSGKIDEVTAVLQAAFTVVAIGLVGFTYMKTRALGALIVAALTAGIFLWTIHNPSWWQDRVGDETDTHAPIDVVDRDRLSSRGVL
jgi:hypothetical protein